MKAFLLSIEKFRLQLHKVKPTDVFTSYATLEVRIIIESSKVVFDDYNTRKFANSIFKDDEIRTFLLSKFHMAMKQ